MQSRGKKARAVFLAGLGCAVLLSVPCSAIRYLDVELTNQHYGIVKQATILGLLHGMDNRTFMPDEPVTRGQMAQALYNRYGSRTTQTYQFYDVPDEAWYAAAIAWANETGVMEVIGNGKFDPEGTMTIEQIAAVLYGFAGRPEVNVNAVLAGYADYGEVSQWSRLAMAWAIQNAVVKPADGGLLRPGKVASRADLAQIMVNFVKKIEKGPDQIARELLYSTFENNSIEIEEGVQEN